MICDYMHHSVQDNSLRLTLLGLAICLLYEGCVTALKSIHNTWVWSGRVIGEGGLQKLTESRRKVGKPMGYQSSGIKGIATPLMPGVSFLLFVVLDAAQQLCGHFPSASSIDQKINNMHVNTMLFGMAQQSGLRQAVVWEAHGTRVHQRRKVGWSAARFYPMSKPERESSAGMIFNLSPIEFDFQKVHHHRPL